MPPTPQLVELSPVPIVRAEEAAASYHQAPLAKPPKRSEAPGNDGHTKPARAYTFRNHQNTIQGCIGAYLRFVWVDALVIHLFGILVIVLKFVPNSIDDRPQMPFRTHATGDNLELRFPTDFLYPYQDPPLSEFQCSIIFAVVPIAVIGLFQLRTRSIWDYHAGQIGTFRALTTTSLFVLFFKHYSSAFRPHFYDACRPSWTELNNTVIRSFETHLGLFFNATICTGDKTRIRYALQSFPSSQAADSFAAATFLALYINAKLKTIGDHTSHYWALLLTVTPFFLASIVAASIYITHQNHSVDIYAGALLGTAIGTISYRSVFAAVFDPRYNHIPLPLFAAKTQFSYFKRERQSRIDVSDEHEEIDKLVVWGWWKSRPSEEGRVKERFWLRNIHHTRATGCERAFELKPTPTQNEQRVVAREPVVPARARFPIETDSDAEPARNDRITPRRPSTVEEC